MFATVVGSSAAGFVAGCDNPVAAKVRKTIGMTSVFIEHRTLYREYRAVMARILPAEVLADETTQAISRITPDSNADELQSLWVSLEYKLNFRTGDNGGLGVGEIPH